MAKSSTSFKGGQSGNPGGRKGVPSEVRKILDEITPEAARELRELLKDPDPKIRMAAVREALDRGLGKAPQSINHGIGDGEEGTAEIATFRLVKTGVLGPK